MKIYYSVSNGGDGSAYPQFSLNERYVDIHQELENMHEGWGEPCTGYLEVESDSEIKFKKEDITKKSLLEDISYRLESKYTSESDKKICEKFKKELLNE